VGSTNPRELRFIASAGGLADAYAGRCTPATVAKNMVEHWYERVKPSGVKSGLYRRITRDELDRLVDEYLTLFPEGRVVHMMRDGRDVSASFVSKPFGPDEVFEGLEEWRARMIEAHEAEQRAPQGRVMRVDLEQLAATRRDETLTELLEFLGLRPDRRMREWFDKKVMAAQAHVGRWRKDYDDDTARRIDDRYGEIIDELNSLGVPHP
jgi:hypothetical protein